MLSKPTNARQYKTIRVHYKHSIPPAHVGHLCDLNHEGALQGMV